MKDAVKWIVIAVLLVAVVAGASVMYNKYSVAYLPPPVTTTSAQEDTTTAEKTTQSSNNEEGKDYSAPDFTVYDYNGNEVKLSDFEGKQPVVLNFWATWCYYCKEEMPHFNDAYKKYPDVKFLMVNVTDGVRETVDIAKEYVDEEAFDFDVYFDTQMDAVSTYNVYSYPVTFFINENGELVTYASGMLDYESLETGIGMIRN